MEAAVAAIMSHPYIRQDQCSGPMPCSDSCNWRGCRNGFALLKPPKV